MSDIYLGTLTALIGVIGTLTAIWFKYYLDRKKNKHNCIIDQTIREDGELLENQCKSFLVHMKL
jgi:hypothetical protein